MSMVISLNVGKHLIQMGKMIDGANDNGKGITDEQEMKMLRHVSAPRLESSSGRVPALTAWQCLFLFLVPIRLPSHHLTIVSH